MVANNLPVQAGQHAVRVLRAKVTDVDTRRYTVDVTTDQDNKNYPNAQIGSPYYNYIGEGFGCMPDIGTVCLIAVASDDTPATVLCFLDLPGMATPSELEAASGNAADSPVTDEAKMSFAGAKPPGLPGDIWITNRDGPFTYWRRGGILQEGTSLFCQRMYNRTRNYIRDFSENYQLATVGSDLLFESERAEDSDSAAAGMRCRLQSNRLLEDTKASVLVEAGRLGGNLVLRLAVTDAGIDRATGAYSNAPVEITFCTDGTVEASFKDTTVNLSSLTLAVTGDVTTRVSGSHDLTALNSSETVIGVKRIEAAAIELSGQVSMGPGGQPLAGNADLLYSWLVSHTHLVLPGNVTGPPVAALPQIRVPTVTA